MSSFSKVMRGFALGLSLMVVKDAMLMQPLTNDAITPVELDVAQYHISSQGTHESQRNDSIDNPHLLEDLLYKYGSDKSKDDHSYSDLYQMLFNPIRLDVKNITEIGVAAGQSIQTWYHYFPNAHIHTFDHNTKPSIPKVVAQLKDRVSFTEADLLEVDNSLLEKTFRLADESMDIIIEDAKHAPWQQEAFLVHLWRLLKPGGIYIIEDVNLARESARQWYYYPEKLQAGTRDIITNQGDTIVVNTAIGHRAWPKWLTLSRGYAKDWQYHNSHLVVLRKRSKPLPEQVKMHMGSIAMQPDKVLLDDP